MEEEIGKIKQEFENKLKDIRSEVIDLTRRLDSHKHTGLDKTTQLNESISLKDQSYISMGNAGVTSLTFHENLSDEENRLLLFSGRDRGATSGNETTNTQLTLANQPKTNGTTNQSFFYGFRSPLWTNSGISITSGGNTMTDSKKNWTTDALIGAYVDVYDSTGTFKETRTITDNTATQITVGTNWSFTDSSSTYVIFMPVYLGSAEVPWRRIYTTEGTGGGIRIGEGVTNGGQNGLIYMDSTGDLYWRNKGGTSAKINGATVYSGYVNSDGTAGSLPSGWSSTRRSSGAYTITHNLGTANYTCCCIASAAAAFPKLNAVNTDNVQPDFIDAAGSLTDSKFYFILTLF